MGHPVRFSRGAAAKYRFLSTSFALQPSLIRVHARTSGPGVVALHESRRAHRNRYRGETKKDRPSEQEYSESKRTVGGEGEEEGENERNRRVKEGVGRECRHGLVNFTHERQLPAGDLSLTLRRVAKSFPSRIRSNQRQCFGFLASVSPLSREISRGTRNRAV